MPTFQEIQNMQVGVWDYKAGEDGTLDTSTLVADSDIENMDEVRVLTISVIAGPDGGALQVDDRDTITIPANQALTLNPKGTLRNPVLYFSGTSAYLVEFVTNNLHGSTRGDIN